MVMRKTSIPYPASPAYEHSTDPHQNLVPDAADIPPIPPQRHSEFTNTPGLQDTPNPWLDAPGQQLRSDRPLPDILKPGPPRPLDNNGSSSQGQPLTNIPHVLRAGQSQEDTPRSSLDSQSSKDFWEESDEEQDKGRKSPVRSPVVDANKEPWFNIEPAERSPGVKRKPVHSPQRSGSNIAAGSSLSSKNPFRRASPPDVQNSSWDGREWENQEQRSLKGKEPDRPTRQAPIEQFQGMSIGTNTASNPSTYTPQPDGQTPAEIWDGEKQVVAPPMPHAPPPPPPAGSFSGQPPLIPSSTAKDHMDNPWASNLNLTAPTPSPIPFAPSQKQVSNYNDDLLDREQKAGAVSLGDELETLPNAAQPSAESREEPSLLDDEDNDVGPPLPARSVQRSETEYFEPPEGPPPPKPPRPSLRTTIPSDEEVARMVEQRNETYQIKHFNWFDHQSRKLRRSAMLTQNKNGPCPLLALVNALILGATDASQAALDEALRSREQVSLGLIIETLMDELLSRGERAMGQTLPDVDELNEFLMRLRTGMNANPRFVPSSSPPPNLMDADDSDPQEPASRPKYGTFEATPDMKLYAAFSVPLIHGWLPEPGSDAARAFMRSAPTYEDAQALLFGEEELEYKLSTQGLSEAEQNMWADINSIKNFLRTYPTQLTPTGLEAVQDSIRGGSFAIMFRNDHFSTIYKHPENGQIFTLITDAGYADRDEIIWESLVDISGKNNEFFSGDFMPVSHNDGGQPTGHGPSQQHLSAPPVSAGAGPLSPQEQQEQHDADFAMALQLQEEEEQRQRAERNRRRSSANPSTPNTGAGRGNNNNNINPRRSTGAGAGVSNIPISVQPPAEARPAIPPRTSHNSVAATANTRPGVNRPADALDDDAPPAYEEAAKGDHVGPEVMAEALRVLDVVETASDGKVKFQYNHQIAGGCSIDKHGTPITDEVLRIAKEESDAVLFGSVGGPEWGTTYPNPESGLLRLRQHLNAFANIRPCTFYSRSLIPLSPLKESIAEGTNFILLRENCGGAYFGPKVEETDFASDSWAYRRDEIERCARVAAALATTMGQDGKGKGTGPPATVWSSDKANVLASGRLWRRVTSEVFAKEFPHIPLKHQLADSLSMLMVKNPRMFNGIIHTDNTFGDMLSDQAGGVVGTLGVLPSASLCGVPDGKSRCNGIYEPVHGSAPDIAGKGIVNPVAQILSAAMMLRYSFGLAHEAAAVEQAVQKVLDGKDIGGLEIRSGDLGGKATTREIGDAVCQVLQGLLKGNQ
ncbi:3-isopropylmalate dehydrogenase, partial [Aureobasidium melanogenum]